MSRNISFPNSPKGPPLHLHNTPPSCSHVIFSVLCFTPPFFYQHWRPSQTLPRCLGVLLALSLVSACFAWFQLPPFSLFFLRITWIVPPDLGGKPFPLLYVFCTLLLSSPFGSPVQILPPASLAILIIAKLMDLLIQGAAGRVVTTWSLPFTTLPPSE